MEKLGAAVFALCVCLSACSSIGTPSADGSGGSGSGGSPGSGGADGTAACQAVVALDRSCTSASDCYAALHRTNCCGQHTFIGIRASGMPQYEELEGICELNYPVCGCGTGQTTADDGSKVRSGAKPGVACIQGICTTFITECGKPCAAGTTCFSCSNHNQVFAACTTMCMGNPDCPDSTLPTCQFGSSGNTSGMYCTASAVVCDTL